MTRPVSRRVATVERDLRDRGFTLETGDWVTVARGGSTDLAAVEAPLAVIALTDGRPLSVVSALANAAHQEQIPVLVADQHTRSAVRDILSGSFALAGHTAGRRQFYSVEDRIRLTDDTFACVDAGGDLQWAEASTTAETESPLLELTAGDEIIAVLDSVEALACPGPEPDAFPARYTRSDGQFQVFDSEGMVARYGTLSSMGADGYRPVPLPLVPEHHIREHPSLARATLFAVASDETVTYDKVR